MCRSYSELIAGFFFVGWGLITAVDIWTVAVAGAPAILFVGLYAVAGILSGQAIVLGIAFFIVVLVRIGWIVFNVRLLIGYWRQSRGKLNQRSSDRLWITTIIYSGIFFFPSLYYQAECMIGQQCFAECTSYGACGAFLATLSEFSTVFTVLTLWWACGTFLPFLALFSGSDEVMP